MARRKLPDGRVIRTYIIVSGRGGVQLLKRDHSHQWGDAVYALRREHWTRAWGARADSVRVDIGSIVASFDHRDRAQRAWRKLLRSSKSSARARKLSAAAPAKSAP